MADQELLAILKQGAEVWNEWWANWNKNSYLLDFRGADLDNANLFRAHLLGADLGYANLNEVNLSGADLRGADLRYANLSEANLSGANLAHANLHDVSFSRANLSKANLSWANFTGAYLLDADLRGADLLGAHLGNANLSNANLRQANLRASDLRGAVFSQSNLNEVILGNALLGQTIFSAVDLNAVIGLDEVNHFSPSTIGRGTLQSSIGKIPVEFLRGCGLSDFEIESAKLYNPDLSTQEINDILYKIYDLRARQAIQISPLFISYSRKDDAFVDRLEVELNERGIRFWRDIHDATVGPLEKQIEQAIRQNPTVLLVLSKNALESDWVEYEVRKGRELAKELNRHVLCPVTLDHDWKESSRWPGRIKDQVMEYNILDFSQWQDDKVFQKMFVKLLDGLQLFYKK